MKRGLDYLYVGLGGAAGAVLRTLVEQGARGLWPGIWGVLAINLLGSFGVGLLAALLLERVVAPDSLRLFLTVGILGGFTTFGALAAQAASLAQSGHAGLAIAVPLGEIGLGVLAAAFGQGVARTVFGGLRDGTP